MSAHLSNTPDALSPLIGEWKILASFDPTPPADIGARVTFEWL